jgi:2,4-dienoyl-CoA reductase-like NADH-dependent reductase (Old Yellow Enzyme family)
MKTELLFQPFDLGALHLDNRIVMAPMTRNFSPENTPGEDVASYYRRRAEGGTALIITEGTAINHPVAVNSDGIPVFYGEKPLAGWKKVVDEVHAAGGKIMPQLWHQGMERKPGAGPNADLPSVGPSGLLSPGKQVAEPMSEAEVQDVINAFAAAALDAKNIGFDGVELHGAHGYLLDQFFWEGTNVRTDEFGGDLVGRTSFVAEIVKAVRKLVGPDYPIILRFSQWKQRDYTAKLAQTPEELGAFLAPLTEAGVDCYHCSTRRYWEPEFEGSDLNLAGWTKKLTGKPTITVGSVSLAEDFFGSMAGQRSDSTGAQGMENLIDRLDGEEFDLVAVGRALLVDPDWANKVKDEKFDELLPFTKEAMTALT